MKSHYTNPFVHSWRLLEVYCIMSRFVAASMGPRLREHPQASTLIFGVINPPYENGTVVYPSLEK